ncbi:MAG TPA: hypothetical protein VK901_19830 [Nitrospiraceae bacterium]|nr:hypothetical protein [Nitrospiraceae bacterium]
MRRYHIHILGIGLLGVILATGCAGKGERIDLKIPIASGANEKVVTMSSATVAIQPFEDHRTDRSHLGTRQHLWGGESHFSLPNGTLGEATAEAFADYLKGKGWNVSVSKGDEAAGADMTITGKLVDVGVDAKSGIGQTTLNAKSRMVVHVKNRADGSQVRETLTGVGSNQVFWFDPEDAQELINELYNKNFEKFVTDTKVDGRILKLR